MGSPGRIGWVPTDAQRAQVKIYAAVGLTHDQIGQIMGHSARTLQRRCKEELAGGLIEANAKIGAKLFQMAMAGDRASVFFWLKTRAGWKETSVVENVGKDGAALAAPVVIPADVLKEVLAQRLSDV